MAPTGPMTSWQILLEIKAASSKSVGWARSVIAGPLFLTGVEVRLAAHNCNARHAGQQEPLAH
jgi:hypothetical protein